MPETHPTNDSNPRSLQPATSSTGRSIHLGQFRLTRLQVVNWGTFAGYKDLRVDERGVLFTGPSGSGKSSLMDAHSVVLLPTHDQRFNASADLTARGSKQATRSVADYVRGAWSETNDEHEQSQVRYLRAGKSTWSAIAATYSDGLGSTTTAVVVKWFPGAETDGGSLKTMHQLHRGDFDLRNMEQWAERGYNLTWFKSTYPDTYRESQAAYMRELGKRIGLGSSKTALALLGKAKAMKNVGDLNLFIRENMLDLPETFSAAQKMVDAFTPLNEAYKTAQRAHAQEKVLRDVPENWEMYRTSADARSRAEALLGASMELYLRGVLLGAVEGELDEIDEAIQGTDAELGDLSTRRDAAYETFRSLDKQLDAEGGALRDLETDLKLAKSQADARLTAHRGYAGLVSRLGRQVPEDQDTFAELHAELRDIADRAQHELDEQGPQRHTIYAAAVAARDAYRDKSRDLESVRTSRTLIPPKHIERRDIIAEGARVPADDLPYAAELIDVVDGEDRWRPVAEKVLRNFGLRLLVPERHQDAVKRFIDEHDMRGLVEYSVVPAASAVPNRPAPNTLAAKLTVNTEHPAGRWLTAHLASRFDHVCVETAQDLAPHRLAVTVRGTVKMPGNHYRKDDRHELTDPSSYILGGNIAAKQDALEAEVTALKTRVDRTAQEADQLEQALSALTSTRDAAQKLTEYSSWIGIDHRSAEHNVEDIEGRIAELKANNVNLRELEAHRNEAEEVWNELAGKCLALKNKLTDYNQRQTALVQILESEQVKAHTIEDPDDRAYLDDALADVEIPVTVDSMPQVRSAFRKELEHRRENADGARALAHSKIKSAINRFLEDWSDSAPDTSGDVERTGGDFAQLHADIVERKLPDAMARFERMISEDMVPSISLLHRTIENASSEIRSRIDMVNAGLKRVEFDSGSHLQIERKASEPVEAREFRGKVDTLLRDAATARREPHRLMQQFRRVQELMARFTGTDTEAKRWRSNVLDVRNAYTFYGREENTDGETTKTYRNTASNSGGEQEKLVAFCLAAALSYNLADRDSDGRPSFAPLMLDEAFSKSDEKYAQQALAAFEEFGFQLIMAAPIRMVGIVEPFIGQAVLVDKRVTATEARSTAQTATFGELLARATDDQYQDARASA